METIFQDKNKYAIWKRLEYLYIQAMLDVGVKYVNPKLARSVLRKIDSVRITDEFVNSVRKKHQNGQHEMLAFLSMFGKLPYMHVGLTSSDIMDTAMFIQLCDADIAIMGRLLKLNETLKKLAVLENHLLTPGRTHGMYAETTTVGIRYMTWYDSISRHIASISNNVYYCKMSGPIGIFTGTNFNDGWEIQQRVAKCLNMCVMRTTTQVIDRTVLARMLFNIILMVTTLEKICTDMRLLCMDGINEIMIVPHNTSASSSSMRHKNNPHLCERVCGISRNLSSMTSGILHNCVLWLERDLTNSTYEHDVIPRVYSMAKRAIETTHEAVRNIRPNLISTTFMDTNLYKHMAACDESFDRKIPHHKFTGTINQDMYEKYIRRIYEAAERIVCD